jgi:hypothetical protein
VYKINKRKRKRNKDNFNYIYNFIIINQNWHFLLYSSNKISQISEIPITIKFNKKALNKDSEE